MPYSKKKIFNLPWMLVAFAILAWSIVVTLLVNYYILERELMMWIAPIVVFILSLFGSYLYLKSKSKDLRYRYLKAFLISASVTVVYLFVFLISTFNSAWN